MSRILFLLPFPPRLDAPHGGGRATAQLLLRLAERHTVALLYLQARDEPPLDPALAARCAHVQAVRRPKPSGRLLGRAWHTGRVFAGLLRGRPVWVTDWSTPLFAARLRALARTWQPDIVQAEFHVMAQYLPALRRSPAKKVLVQHEPGAAAARSRRRSGLAPGLLLPWLDERAWERYEQRSLDAVQAVVVFTVQDRQTLARTGSSTPIVQIPLGAELPPSALDTCQPGSPSLLFVGSYTHPPNVEAALRLAFDLFPALKARVPGLRLFLVGENPPAQLSERSDQDVVVTGRVPDVTPYLEQASVVVAPLQSGGGMHVKVLEALAAGKALVASPLALAGLDVRDGEQVLTAESDAQFHRQILELLEDPCRRQELGESARRWALDNLGWEPSLCAYDRLYNDLINGRGKNGDADV